MDRLDPHKREDAIALHRMLWGWLAENPTKKKEEWPGWKDYPRIQRACFACELVDRDSMSGNKCQCCFEWPVTRNNSDTTPCLNSYFENWMHSLAPEERSKYAALIRDLPEARVKEKVKAEPPIESQFKVGDKVRVVDTGGLFTTYDTFFAFNNLSHLKSKWKERRYPEIGQTHKVVAIGRHGSVGYGPIYVLEDSNGIVYLMNNRNRWLELVEKAEPKFKVGDKVRAVAETNCWGCVNRGDVGVITHTPDMHPTNKILYRADFPSQHAWNGEERCFELVVEETLPANHGEPFADITPELAHIVNGPATIVIVYGENGKQYKGVAKCAEGDVFDRDKGFQIALLRATIKRDTAKLKKLCK